MFGIRKPTSRSDSSCWHYYPFIDNVCVRLSVCGVEGGGEEDRRGKNEAIRPRRCFTIPTLGKIFSFWP